MVTWLYYTELLDQFDAESQKKRPNRAKEKVFFQRDNAPAHIATVVTAKLVELGYDLLDRPPYSPCDFLFFPNLKKLPRNLSRMRMSADLPKTYFST